jgi:hypothetical protein
MASSQARVSTDRPERYLTQLCKHFSHKLPVEFTDSEGKLTFSSGVCHLRAESGTLVLDATAADAESLDRTEDVVARHLVRFGARNELVVTWTRTGENPPAP